MSEENTDSNNNNNNKPKLSRSLAMMVAPAVMVALVMSLAIPGAAFVPAGPLDALEPHGYVEVIVTRDGQEIYHHEDHNVITNAGVDFISAQIGSTSPGGNGANYIGLTTTNITPDAGDTTLSGEITTNGLERSQGAYAHTNGQNTFTVTETFTASGTHSNVQGAGLFNAASNGTMMAINEFTAVTLQSGDELTITWTITIS